MIVQANLSGIQAFCLTYELGNFTEAAKAMGLSPQAVSRAVGRLEQDLGVTLFRRNTRHLHATEQGRLYYVASRAALDQLLDAERVLAGDQANTSQGRVRISVPTTYGHHRFLPWMAEFQAQYPGIEVEVEVSNENVDFVREGFDMAIRMGDIKKDASYVARRLGDFSLGVFASPIYLAKHGIPAYPMELEQHRCVVFVRPSSGKVLPWVFSPEPEVLIPPSSIKVRHDVLGLISVARTGGGLIQLYHYLVEHELERGELVEVLQAYGGKSRPFSLIYPIDNKDIPSIRAMIDFIMERSLQDPREK
jgi:DNA-binding transcriptional LysR family regulator